MFFIHGGAFYMGTYLGMGPKDLLEHDVVLVEIQYRLGPLGYMCLDHPEIAGNMGMLDQALALEWVKEHIADFGGDPEQITVFGESAGAASATYHMLSPKSKHNFHRVIGESGSALAGWAFDKEPEKHAKEIAARLGCPTDNIDDMVHCLKYEKSIKEIVDTHTEYIVSEPSLEIKAKYRQNLYPEIRAFQWTNGIRRHEPLCSNGRHRNILGQAPRGSPDRRKL